MTCTALVTVRDVMERGVCPSGNGEQARKGKCIQTMTTHLAGMLRDTRCDSWSGGQ